MSTREDQMADGDPCVGCDYWPLCELYGCPAIDNEYEVDAPEPETGEVEADEM